MRLFLREQLPLIFVYIAQWFFVTLVYWLDGYRNPSIAGYAGLLSGCLLVGYLAFRYATNRAFYRKLQTPPDSLEQFTEASSSLSSPLNERLQELLRSQFRLYRAELHNYQHKIEAHIQFINQWVHQMKTPLSVIHLLVQSEDDKRFAAIGDEVDRLRKGLETVLYTARLDAFEHDFHVETLRLTNIVRSVVSDQKRLFIRKRVFPSIQIDEDLKAASDEKWLSFVLTQLITNAVRYTTQENRKIYFTGTRSDSETVLEIRDEGVGIPASDLPRVFEPYFTGENGRHFQESTGMGLYLVCQICDKLGHAVEIESEVGRGTAVRIRFG
ncbi:sensor histidine kinase [Paenibacillus ginsengihumi]|uniref:sensor histidine kinase n=1 Tax=Paenibacillus ginsengihumi TaxID=431596 RepID=UPI0003797A89|nr:sensor histidine kinase [Paenibacillus ginsengihumi]